MCLNRAAPRFKIKGQQAGKYYRLEAQSKSKEISRMMSLI